MIIRLLPLVLGIFLLAGCAETQLVAHVAKQIPASQKTVGTFKVGTPYKIAGKTYVPQETYSFTQTGIASWYGPNFHGKKTANGETFDMYELTAAHKTLQIPSLIRVTNLENGRSIVLRVNDRGPFSKGRVLDVSQRAAELLDFRNKGTAKVKIQLLEQESRKIAGAARRGEDTRGTEVALNGKGYQEPPQYQQQYASLQQENRQPPIPKAKVQQPLQTFKTAHAEEITAHQQPLTQTDFSAPVTREPLQPPQLRTLPVQKVSNQIGSVYIQAGAFGDENRALTMARSLSHYGQARVYPATINGQTLYRVRLGPMSNRKNAGMVVSHLESMGYSNDAMIVVE